MLNQECINITEWRSFYRQINDAKFTDDTNIKYKTNNNSYKCIINLIINIYIYTWLCHQSSVKPKTIYV